MWTDADLDESTLEEWARETEERCAVTDNVENSTPVSITAKSPRSASD